MSFKAGSSYRQTSTSDGSDGTKAPTGPVPEGLGISRGQSGMNDGVAVEDVDISVGAAVAPLAVVGVGRELIASVFPQAPSSKLRAVGAITLFKPAKSSATFLGAPHNHSSPFGERNTSRH